MQAYISQSLAGLDFRKRYGLTEYTDSLKPLVMFGMYRVEDFEVLVNHMNRDITLVWQGMDARELPINWLLLLRRKNIRHIAISHWIKESLDAYGIESELLPVSATIDNIFPVKRGNNIYLYYSDDSPSAIEYYGAQMIPEIEHRTGLKVLTAKHGEYAREGLQAIYRECFINLRLTTYDGCPNTNLEMGLMGRRSIFNGHIPHSIPWQGIDDICASIMAEYETRHEPNDHISTDISKFLNIKFP